MSRGGRCLCFSKEKRNFICSKMFKNTHKTFQPSLLTRFNAQEFFLSVSFFFTAIPYILKHICVVACMRWYYSLMPSYRFNCMCLQFYFSEFSSCYFFLTSASYGSLLLLFLYVFVFYDDFGIIFFRGNFFLKLWKN